MTNENIKKYICSNCGELTDSLPKENENNNNVLIVILLIIFGILLIPVGIGFILLIIALFIPMWKKHEVNKCCYCKSENTLIPTDTPKGKLLLNEFYHIES